MACLRKKGNKYYVKDVVGGKEIWQATKTGDLAEAEQKLRDYISSKNTGSISPFPSKTPLNEILAEFCLNLKNTTRHESYIKDLSRLRNVFGPVCDALKIKRAAKSRVGEVLEQKPDNSNIIVVKSLEEITTVHITLFLNRMMADRGTSKKTVNNYREMLHRFFNWAITQMKKRFPGGINPADNIKLHKIPAPEITYLTRQEIGLQLHALKDAPMFQAMVATLIYAGLRREELLWLRRSDIISHGKDKTSIVVQAKTVDGKSWIPKNKISRSVPISNELKPFLDPVIKGKENQEWLFATPSGARWNPDCFSEELRELNIEAVNKMKADGSCELSVWSCTDYRHTFGTQLASRGISLYVIASMMGNSPDICRKHYAKIFPSTLHHAINSVDDSLVADCSSQLSDVMGRHVPDAPMQVVSKVSDKTSDCKLSLPALALIEKTGEENGVLVEPPEIQRKHLRLLR